MGLDLYTEKKKTVEERSKKTKNSLKNKEVKKQTIKVWKFIKQPNLKNTENNILRFMSNMKQQFPLTLWTIANRFNYDESKMLNILKELEKKIELRYYSIFNNHNHAWELLNKEKYRKLVEIEVD